MKIISMALAAFICLSILGLAVPDSAVTGPYNVTFDLGIPKEAYKVEIEEPEINESLSGEISTQYAIELVNKTGLTRRAAIILTLYEVEQVLPTKDEIVQIIKYAILQIENMHDVEESERMIDGHNGAIASGKIRSDVGIDVDTYSAIYYPSSTTQVIIFSAYPWENSTLSLLESIHVEENNSTS